MIAQLGMTSVAVAACAVAVVAVDAFVFIPGTPKSGWTHSSHLTSLSSTRGTSVKNTARTTNRTIQRVLTEQRHLQNLIESSVQKKECAATAMEEAERAHGMPWTSTIGKSELEEPLLFMPFWEWQMDFMKSSLTNLRVCHKDMTPDQAFRENKVRKARIVSHCYQSDEYRKIRMTYYDAGDNAQVFNTVFYPRPEYDIPILGVDLLAMNRKRYLAVVDFQPLYESGEEGHETKFEHLLRPIRDSYETLKGRMSSKFYDEKRFFSRQMLFARSEDSNMVMRDLFPAFQEYLKIHLNLFQETESKPSRSGAVLQRQRAYDTYSAQRDPATGCFAAMFGEEWAYSFVNDFLFSLSERPTEEEGPKIARSAAPRQKEQASSRLESPTPAASLSQPSHEESNYDAS